MSEAMTSESIVEAEWLLKGYWTKLRFAFQTDKGGWSDVDILAYKPESKHLIVSESKVRGPKDHVYAYTAHTASKYGSIIKYDEDNYFSFLRHLPKLCEDGTIFNNFERMVRKFTVQLVCNYAVHDNMRHKVNADIKKVVDKHRLPVLVDFQLDTTIDVLARIIEAERKSKQGRRYGHPILDMAREINRYFFPVIRYAGQMKSDKKELHSQVLTNFLKALRIKDSI